LGSSFLFCAANAVRAKIARDRMEKTNFFIRVDSPERDYFAYLGGTAQAGWRAGLEANPHWNGSNFARPMLPTTGAVANRYFVFSCQDSRKDLHFFCKERQSAVWIASTSDDFCTAPEILHQPADSSCNRPLHLKPWSSAMAIITNYDRLARSVKASDRKKEVILWVGRSSKYSRPRSCPTKSRCELSGTLGC
jgi:hypothetical protein